MIIPTIISILGMVLVLSAFVLDEFFKRYNQDTVFYNLCNILGSGMLIYYALWLKSWPFIILNLVWFVAGLVKLAEILWGMKKFRY